MMFSKPANQYLKFIKSLLLLVLLILISDQVIGRILKHYYFKQESGLFYRTTYAIDSTTADILVFGSSRANHHYVPQVFEDSLGMSFFNSGRDGNFILFNYAVFKAITVRYTPKILIFDINPGEFLKDKSEYDRLSSLLPYYKTHTEIRSILDLRGSFEKYKMLSEIYPYNSALITIIVGNLEINKKRKNERTGYLPLYGHITDTALHKIEFAVGIPDTNKVNAVLDIVQYCTNKKIKLVFIQSPFFGNISDQLTKSIFEGIAKEHNILFYNFTGNSRFLKDPDLFYDQHHLNDEGAIYFSSLLVKQISEAFNL